MINRKALVTVTAASILGLVAFGCEEKKPTPAPKTAAPKTNTPTPPTGATGATAPTTPPPAPTAPTGAPAPK